MADQSYSSSTGAIRRGTSPYEPDLGVDGTVLGSVAPGARRFTITGVTVVVSDNLTLETTITVSLGVTLDSEVVSKGTFKIPATAVAGDVFTCTDIQFEVQPGEVARAITDGATATAGGCAYFEGYESPVVFTAEGRAKDGSGVGKLYLVSKD